mgnify:CR=1 FL=1
MAYYILDIETTLDHGTIWCVVIRDIDTGKVEWALNPETLKKLIGPQDILIGHNLISFDVPILNRLWKMKIPLTNCIDTLILSRLWKPDLENGHSLDAWGQRLGTPKSKFDKFHEFSQEMLDYCIQDTLVTQKVWEYLQIQLEIHKVSVFKEWSPSWIEHQVRIILDRQENNGFCLDIGYTLDLLKRLREESQSLYDELINTVEPTVVVMKTKTKIIPFNPGSRQQVVDRLMKRGWVPTEFTPTRQPKLSDDILEKIKIPEAASIVRYLLLEKRITQIQSWVDAADENGVVHGYVNTNGAVTGRMTHSGPNMGQIPASYSPFGKECRRCWIPRHGMVLVGCDASGLELRMLAHYMNDANYTETVINGKKEDGTDIHTVNMRAAGLVDRDTAKTFIYAFLYGAGPAKIGLICGVSVEQAKSLIATFLDKTPALKALKEKVSKLSKKGWLPGLDGRKLWVRSEHAALNTLFQAAGALVMKVALIMLDKRLQALYSGWYEFVANVHDEWQIECDPGLASIIGWEAKEAIRRAGVLLKLRCPLDGDFNVGTSWAETH